MLSQLPGSTWRANIQSYRSHIQTWCFRFWCERFIFSFLGEVMIHKKKPKIFSAVGVLELVTFSCLMHLFASSVWSWNELPSVSWGINQEDKGSDLPWPELQCPVDRCITRSFLNLPFPQYNHLGGGVKQPEQEATAAQRRFCSMGMRQGGGAVCQAVSRALTTLWRDEF